MAADDLDQELSDQDRVLLVFGYLGPLSLVSLIGPRPNLLGHASAGEYMRLEVSQPILTNTDIERIRHIEDHTAGAFRTRTIDMCYSASAGAQGMDAALTAICQQAEKAVGEGFNILILSDRSTDVDHIAIPALLATSAVHHHLVRTGLRTVSGLVIETGAAREVHQFATLAGYGAEAINPYLAFETLLSIRDQLPEKLDEHEIQKRYIKAVGKGLFKVMSKMGISTYQSYCGAQIFDAVGLSTDFIDQYFTGTATTIEGIGLKEVAEETVRWHRDAYSDAPIYRNSLDVGGDYAFRMRGEDHMWTPDSIAKLQHATRANDAKTFREYAQLVNDQNKRLLNLRGLFEFNFANEPVPLDEVEPAKEIVKRFSTGAMSFGSISYEAHSTLAVAMNRIGGKSNTGEGGEQPERFKTLDNGDSKRSAIKQVASGRFGVTTEYLVNSDVIQIKMAQGAKPGEGGQLPGHKVDATIAQVRHSTPGVGLISPPPHHDIYSIEDLAQLIHDLKNANPEADISVKLVAEVGVGNASLPEAQFGGPRADAPLAAADLRRPGPHGLEHADLADPCRERGVERVESAEESGEGVEPVRDTECLGGVEGGGPLADELVELGMEAVSDHAALAQRRLSHLGIGPGKIRWRHHVQQLASDEGHYVLVFP